MAREWQSIFNLTKWCVTSHRPSSGAFRWSAAPLYSKGVPAYSPGLPRFAATPG